MLMPKRILMDKDLLKILACPGCESGVILKDEKIVCPNCQRRYPIKDGVPIMLIEEAETDEE